MRTNRCVMALAGLLLAAIPACGGGSPDGVEGIWTFATARGCVEEWEFDNGSARKQVFCVISDSLAGLETLEGGYSLVGSSELRFDLRRASCATTRMTVALRFERRSRSVLSLTYPDGVTVMYDRQRDRTAARASVPGCFEGPNFTFVQRPIQDL
jgi:hypothetical protein